MNHHFGGKFRSAGRRVLLPLVPAATAAVVRVAPINICGSQEEGT